MTNKKNIDRRIKYHLVLDVETAGGLENPLVYDIGYVITDRQGRIYEERSYVIKEIWERTELMQSAYYSNKIPRYIKDLNEGTRKLIEFNIMRNEMFDLMREYEVEVISAYNLQFDMNALQTTSTEIAGFETKFLTSEFKNVELLCIWCFACQVLYTQKSFHGWAMANGYYTAAGNVQTTAEVGFKYLTGDHNFIESHTGLEDVKIETQILNWCYRQNKRYQKGLFPNPWKLPQK